jgi:predicted DCC family thiol-disulfide oxidoreductase YuxK
MRQANPVPPKLIVWYNTKCPVCNAGIDWQEPDALSRFNADVNAVRRRLHAVDVEGRLAVGIDCAIEIWRRTPGDGWLARIVGLPGIRQAAGFGYDRFADLLFAWNRWKRRW